jgi:oxygen-independent coproporphyrinogen-3 oxidase
VRSSNTRELAAYIRRLDADEDATGPTETLDPEARARETAVLMLRRTVLGLERKDFQTRTGFDFDALAGTVLERYLQRGLLEDDGRRIRFRREGLFLADSVLCDLL